MKFKLVETCIICKTILEMPTDRFRSMMLETHKGYIEKDLFCDDHEKE